MEEEEEEEEEEKDDEVCQLNEELNLLFSPSCKQPISFLQKERGEEKKKSSPPSPLPSFPISFFPSLLFPNFYLPFHSSSFLLILAHTKEVKKQLWVSGYNRLKRAEFRDGSVGREVLLLLDLRLRLCHFTPELTHQSLLPLLPLGIRHLLQCVDGVSLISSPKYLLMACHGCRGGWSPPQSWAGGWVDKQDSLQPSLC